MNTLPFRANHEIKDPKILFGRKEELQKLCDFAEGLHQIEVIGARRFGKTCLIKSFITLRKENVNRNSYPLYVDVSSDDIKGTLNIYRYLTSQLVANLLNDGYIEEGVLTIDDFNIIPNKNWKKVFKQLGAVEDEIDQIGIFDEAIELFSRQLGQTILLILDEYERTVDAFDSIDGLRHIRKMTNDSNSLSFWIVGASPWKKFILDCSQDVRGSGVFNGITFNVDVCPLKKDDFHNMWSYECSLIADDTKRKYLESLWEKVFASSGGVPCFAKEIGGFTYIEGNYPQYYRLKNHFVELEKNLTDSEIRCIRKLSISPQEYTESEKPDSVVTLEQYGLICTDENNKYYVASRFFADYIRAGVYEEKLYQEEGISIEAIVKEIITVIYKINDKYKSQYGKFMFDPANNTTLLYQALSTKCDSSEKAPNFVNSIYLLYWEGAKENGRAGEKLPEYFRKTMFRKSMDRIRHILGKAHQQDKLDTNYDQIDKISALQFIIGDSIEPQSPSDWLYFQERMLILFLQELKDLDDSIGKELQDGALFNGVIVEVENKGTIFKNIKYRYWSMPLRPYRCYLDSFCNGEEVCFTAKKVMDPNDPSKSYWMAKDVQKRN